MNFVGHAHVARAIAPDRPALVLGAMLPDFASMARVRLVQIAHPELAAGVALHHRTDEAFHACPEFVRICARTAGALEAQGVGCGSARAAAHVGTEMLLDGLLLREVATRRAYHEAVAQLADPRITGAIRVAGRGEARWPPLIERVQALGAPDFYADPAMVADRLFAILASRPRLALEERHRDVLHREMATLLEEVRRARNALAAAAQSAIRGGAGWQAVP